MEGIYPVGTVVRLTGLSARQIRYYERFGLVAPCRDGNRRLYTDAEVARLTEVRDRLTAGQSLKAIRRALVEAAADDLRGGGEDADVDRLEHAEEEDENDVAAGLVRRLPHPPVDPLHDLNLVQQLMARHARERGAPRRRAVPTHQPDKE
jgi:DNA-binding transcriptional MerR regulator